MKIKNNSFTRVFVFLLIAVLVSNIFRFDFFKIKLLIKKLPTWLNLPAIAFFEASGVFLGALIAIFLLKKHKKMTISFYGVTKKEGLLMACIPIVLMMFFGIKNNNDVNEHFYGFLVGLVSFIYCLMEEIGWRGYLQEEFKDKKPLQRYVLIGFFWYFWHLSFLMDTSSLENLYFFTMLVIGSWGLGQVIQATKSVLVSACFHFLFQILMFNSLIKNGLEIYQKLIIVGVSIIFWILILKKWTNKK